MLHLYRSIMSDVSHDNRVLSLGNRAGLRQNLTTLLDQLGRCQKALNEFLEVSIRCNMGSHDLPDMYVFPQPSHLWALDICTY